MQTHEWEALLDGTTPGPWEWHGDQDPDMRFIYADEGGMCMTVEPVGSDYRDADPVLAAHAPDAVAEVIRLRREVAAFRDQMTKSSEEYKAMYDRGRNLDHLLAAEYDDQIAYVLTRILEGDNP